MISPAMNTASSRGLLSGLLGRGINWSSIISGTGKTLNIINQAIPVVKEISPVMKNAKTMFRVMNEFKKVETPPVNNQPIQNQIQNETKQASTENQTNQTTTQTNGPTFFI